MHAENWPVHILAALGGPLLSGGNNCPSSGLSLAKIRVQKAHAIYSKRRVDIAAQVY